MLGCKWLKYAFVKKQIKYMVTLHQPVGLTIINWHHFVFYRSCILFGKKSHPFWGFNTGHEHMVHLVNSIRYWNSVSITVDVSVCISRGLINRLVPLFFPASFTVPIAWWKNLQNVLTLYNTSLAILIKVQKNYFCTISH